MPSIFDELAAKYGLHLDPPTQALPMVERHQPPRMQPPTRWNPDHAFALLHRHLADVSDSLHARISHLEARIMAALDNLTAQVDALDQTVHTVVIPLLSQPAGVPDEQLQPVADRISGIVSDLNTAVSTVQQG